jgi:hypothetical protein
MNAKVIMWLTIAINLIVGNAILYLLLKNSSLLGRVSFHTVASVVAFLMLMILFRKVTRNTKKPIMIALSLFGALLVPTLTTFIITAWTGISDSTPDAVVKAGFLAVVSGFSFWHLWVPFGIVNALLLYKYLHCNINGT